MCIRDRLDAQAIRIKERNRIIELLENELGDMRPVEPHSVGVYDGLDHAIELIKGETR